MDGATPLTQEKTMVYTLAEVQAMLRVSRITMLRMLQGGRLKGFKAGKLWRVRAVELERFMEGKGGNDGRAKTKGAGLPKKPGRSGPPPSGPGALAQT